jgi:uncharacterized protein (DUF885 family)
MRLLAVVLTIAVASCSSAARHGASGPGETVRPEPDRGAARSAGAGGRVTGIADDYYQTFLKARPLTAFVRALPNAPLDGVDDNSLAGTERWRRQEDRWLAELRAVDPSALRGQEVLLYQLLHETLTSSVATRVCHNELWPVSQQGGVQQLPTTLAGLLPVGSSRHRARALSRYRSLERNIDNAVAALRLGMQKGFTAPRGNVEAVVKQLDRLLAIPPDSSPILRLAVRDGTPDFRRALAGVVRGNLYPALRRYRDFLSTEYLPRARASTAISELPGGRTCYRARVRAFTSLEVTPEAVHQLGLDEMGRIETEMRAIAQRRFGTSDLPALFDRLRSAPEFKFSSRDEVVDTARSALERVRAQLPRWFGRLPRAEMMLDPCLPFEEESGCPNSYLAAAQDGSRPARWRINTSPVRASRVDLEAIAFHEGYPGHHLQIALSQEQSGAHPVSRLLSNSGFAEGWGLYSERVANEMGVYSGDLAQLGRLSNAAFRAARLVVDPGLHVLGWSRDRAIEYMLAHTAIPAQGIAAEVDRYIINPGQATAYMLGRVEIERLRKLAEIRLGSAFDISAFHDRVLQNGNVPLPLLRRQMEAWLDSTGAASPTR